MEGESKVATTRWASTAVETSSLERLLTAKSGRLRAAPSGHKRTLMSGLYLT